MPFWEQKIPDHYIREEIAAVLARSGSKWIYGRVLSSRVRKRFKADPSRIYSLAGDMADEGSIVIRGAKMADGTHTLECRRA